MADAAAARREARRKRILENSHNRLQLISGKCAEDCPREPPVRTVIPESFQEISAPVDIINTCGRIALNNGVILSETDTFELLTHNEDTANHNSSGDADILPSDLASFVAPTLEQPSVRTSFWEKLTNCNYDIVLLSFLIQLCYCMTLANFEGTYFFLPVLVYSLTKLIWFPAQNNSKLSNILMLLQGMSSYRVQKLLYITQCVGVVSRDICVFLFTTICLQSLLITLKSGLIT